MPHTDPEDAATHTGEIDVPAPSDADRKAMFERYAAHPNPLAGKEVIGVSLLDSEL
jgi:hypothetical protein